jgi:RNA polymerase sigma factor (sigma-70 family)
MAKGQLAPSPGLRPTPAAGPLPDELPDGQLLERFIRRQDEAAFAALVRRHGPMVLAVCQRVLRHAQDAEDAFQATFLVLVHKAASLKNQSLLANWLYGVAYRTAQHARARAALRCRHEREAKPMAAAAPDPEPEWHELRERLDEELQHLPEKYRAPLVLCYLEGRTNEEAARLLGWPAGSMSARLARGRELLRERLGRRDWAIPLAFVPLLLTRHTASAGAVPQTVVDATVESAVQVAAGQTLTAAQVSPAVESLTQAVLHGLASAHRRWLLTQLVAVGLALLGLGLAVFTFGGNWLFGGACSSCHAP